MKPKKPKASEFFLFNHTDHVYVWPEPFATREEAAEAARQFRARFARQGYYLTASWLKLALEDIELEIIPAGRMPGERGG